jgi:hypothetical protein
MTPKFYDIYDDISRVPDCNSFQNCSEGFTIAMDPVNNIQKPWTPFKRSESES